MAESLAQLVKRVNVLEGRLAALEAAPAPIPPVPLPELDPAPAPVPVPVPEPTPTPTPEPSPTPSAVVTIYFAYPLQLGSPDLLWVSVYGSATFDASQIDPTSVTLGDGMGKDIVATQWGAPVDYSGDGYKEFPLAFSLAQLEAIGVVTSPTSRLVIRGSTPAGPFAGSSDGTPVPPVGGSVPPAPPVVPPNPVPPTVPPVPGPTSGSRPLVGVIRHDDWDSSHLADPTQNARLLTDPAVRYRLPFFATESGGVYSMNEATQQVIDQEILQAYNAGIGFWAINHACTWGLYARDYLMTSPHKSLMKVCSIETASSQCRVDTVLSWMSDSSYLTVLGGRPVIFLLMQYYNSFGSPATLTALRNSVIGAGHPNPYVIAMDFSAAGAASYASTYGADAISTYGGGVVSGAGTQPYSYQVAAEESGWAAYRDTGWQSIPIVTTGWDSWYAPGSFHTTPEATPSEIANHLQNALAFAAANPSTNQANLLLLSAWNEYTENHYLSPYNQSTNPIGSGRLDAVASVFAGG